MAPCLFLLLCWFTLGLPEPARAQSPTPSSLQDSFGLRIPEVYLTAEELKTGVALNTAWHFVGPDGQAYITEVPSRWEKIYQRLWPVFGKGVYTLDVSIPKSFVGKNLKLFDELIAGSEVHVFVNNKHVGENGLRPGSDSRITDFPVFTAHSERLRLRVEVLNETLQWSGLVQPLWLGTSAAIYRKSYRRNIDFNSMIAVFLFLAFFHLILFALFRQDTTVFWFGALCFCIVIYMEFFRMHNLEYVFGDIPLEWNIRVIRLALYAIVPLAFWYAHSLSSHYVGRRAVWVITAISTAFVSTLVLPGRLHSPLVYVWFIFIILCVGYNAYLLVRLFLNHQLNTSIYAGLALNGLIFSVSCLNEVMNALHIWKNGFHGRYGFLLFCLIQTCFLAARLQRNIRESSRLQHELKHINENLEHLVAVRTDEVQRQHVQLQELMHFKAEMVDMLVHDLKTPLNMLMNLPKRPHTGELPLAMEAGERVNTLIRQMIEINHKEGSQLPLHLRPHSLHELCQKVIRIMQPWAFSKDILLANLLTSQSQVLVDAPLFERVIQNLLENALKHAPEHSEIKITGHLHADVFQCCIFNLSPPLPRVMLHSIFDKGISVEGSNTPVSTGLGLYFCRQVLRAHGGDITVENIPCSQHQEAGVQFVLDIPTPHLQTEFSPPWNKDQLRRLLPEVKNLLRLEVYQISELRPILKRLQEFEDSQTKTWVQHLQTSIKEVNEQSYHELLQQICTHSDY